MTEHVLVRCFSRLRAAPERVIDLPRRERARGPGRVTQYGITLPPAQLVGGSREEASSSSARDIISGDEARPSLQDRGAHGGEPTDQFAFHDLAQH